MTLSTDIQNRCGRREQTIQRTELVHRRTSAKPVQKLQADKLWTLVKPKVAAELAPVIKRLTAAEKTRITVKEAEAMIDARLAKLEKQSRRRHEDLYNKLREL